MARRASAELETAPLPKPPRHVDGAAQMLAVGQAHVLHAVGPLLGSTGARASMCGIYGSFYEAPPRSDVPSVHRLFRGGAPVNELEVRAALLHALRRPWPCNVCPINESPEIETTCGPDERLARAIEDGDVRIQVTEGAWL